MRKETLRGSADRGCLQRRRTALRPRPRPGAVRAAGLPHAPPIGAAVNSSDLRSTVDMQLLPSEVSVCGRCASPPVRVVRGEEPTDSASFPSASDAGHDDPPRPGGLLCMVVFFFFTTIIYHFIAHIPPNPPSPSARGPGTARARGGPLLRAGPPRGAGLSRSRPVAPLRPAGTARLRGSPARRQLPPLREGWEPGVGTGNPEEGRGRGAAGFPVRGGGACCRERSAAGARGTRLESP